MKNMQTLAERYIGEPLAMLPAVARALVDSVLRMTDESVAEALAAVKAAKTKKKAKRDTGVVAVIALRGAMEQYPSIATELFGGTACSDVAEQLDQAVSGGASEIILDIDSPGGSVYGVGELGQKIAEASKKVKVTACVNSLCASAAYWAASQASVVAITPSGECGGVGVFMTHCDVSKAMEEAGQKVTFISAGERKVCGNPYGPLDDMSRAELQGGVDDYYALFVRAVAKGRNTTQVAVREGFGKGGMVRAEQALKGNMADKIAPFDAILRQAVDAAGGSRATAARPGFLAEVRRGAVPAGFDFEVELRKRKMRMAEDGQFRLMARNTPPSSPPSRPAGRSQEADWRVCLHEAGHGVVALCLGVDVLKVSAQPAADGEGTFEFTAPGSGGLLAVAFAGSESELLAGYRTQIAAADLKLAQQLAAPGSPEWWAARGRARRLLEANRASVQRVAEALTLERTLTAARLRAVAGELTTVS